MSVSAGSEVDAWCTKCRMDLMHRVVAAVAGTPKRVECQTCRTQHNYRAPKGAKDPIPKGEEAPGATKKTTGTPPKAKAKATARVSEWDKRVLGQTEATFKAYTPRATFRVDELLRHTKFGDGFVSELSGDGKITVVFRDGAKTLVHGR